MQILEVPTKKTKLSVYLQPELKNKLENLAKLQKRSVNNMIEFLVEEAVVKVEKEKDDA